MEWTSLADIIQRLHLQAAPGDVAAVEAELERERQELHPDRTGGVFTSAERETRYHEVQSALSFVRGLSRSTAIEPYVAAVLALERANAALVSQVAEQRRESDRRQREAELAAQFQRATRRAYFVPRLSSGVLLVICSFLLAIPKVVREQPVLAPIGTLSVLVLSVLPPAMRPREGALVNRFTRVSRRFNALARRQAQYESQSLLDGLGDSSRVLALDLLRAEFTSWRRMEAHEDSVRQGLISVADAVIHLRELATMQEMARDSLTPQE